MTVASLTAWRGRRWRPPGRAVWLALLAAVPLCLWLHGPTPWALAWFVFHGLLAGVVAAELRSGTPSPWLSLAGVVAGLAVAAGRWPEATALVAASAGAGAGFAVVWLAGQVQARWRPAAQGQGSLPEAVLFAMAGAWLGWRALPALMLGSFVVLALGRLGASLRVQAARSVFKAFHAPVQGTPAAPWSPALAVAIVVQEVLQHAS